MKLFTKQRRKARYKLYASKHWKKRTLLHRKNNPLCVRCFARGQYKRAQCSDHDNPLWKGREILTFKLNALCRECHQDKTFCEDLPKIKLAEKTQFKFFK